MAKKTTTKKAGTTKSKSKSSVKTKSKVTKKKPTTAKAVTKKKSAAKAAPKKKSTVTKKVTKKAVPKKSTLKKKSAAKKPAAKKTTTKKAEVKKRMPDKQKTTENETVVKKKSTAKKATSPKATKKTVKREIVKKPVITRAEALQKIKGYGKKDLEDFRAIIIEKRDEILEDLQSLKEQMLDPTTGEYINENSPYSLHMAEQGTDAMEREKTFLYAQRENKFLAYLDDALKRIDSGVYGICVECIEEPQNLCETCPLVPKARLIAVPHTQHCLPIKQRKGGR